MLEIIGIGILVLVSVFFGWAMGRDGNSKSVQYTQNVYTPEALQTADIYQQTQQLLNMKDEDDSNRTAK